MRKSFFVVVVCVVALCCLLTLPLFLGLVSPVSEATPQTTPQNSSEPTPQTTIPEATPQTPQETAQLAITQNIPQNRSAGASQSTQQTSSEPIPPVVQEPTNRTLEEIVGNATNYLAQTKDPFILLDLNVIYRQFGITEFADALNQYDQLLAKNPANAPLLRIFRRIADYDNTPQDDDFYAVTDVADDLNRITVPALYSDRLDLPDSYLLELNNAADSGGYLLTHALLATIWLEENHCEQIQIPSDFAESLYYDTAALIGNGSVVNDLEVEAADFLYTVGQGELVSDAFVQRVIATQNYDGGWSASSDTPVSSHPHTSVLALSLLLYVEFPAASYPPMLALATSYDSVCLDPLVLCSIAVYLCTIVNIGKKTVQFSLNHQWHVI